MGGYISFRFNEYVLYIILKEITELSVISFFFIMEVNTLFVYEYN